MPKRKREAAFVFPVEQAVSMDAQTFPAFPGLYTPGEPVKIADLGFETVADAQARADELGLPLKRTAHAFPADDDVAESALEASVTGESAPSAPEGERPAEETPAPGLTEDELEAREAEG